MHCCEVGSARCAPNGVNKAAYRVAFCVCGFLVVAVAAGFGGADFLLLQFSWGEKKEKKKWKSDSRREWPVPQDDAVNC